MKLLQAFTPWDAQEAADVESALRAVRAFDDIASRSNPIVHLCASPWIMSRDMKKVLLVYHRIYDSWGCERLMFQKQMHIWERTRKMT